MRANVFRGIVSRVLSRGAFGGAIFSLQTRVESTTRGTDRKTILVVADTPLFREPPTEGEPWEVFGHWEDRPKYGFQLKAESAKLWKPSGLTLVEFLSSDIWAAVLKRGDARRLWSLLGPNLAIALDARDIERLKVQGMSFRRCRALVDEWQTYWSVAALRNLLPPDTPTRTRRTIHALFGTEASQRVFDNPYRLAPLLPWPILDAFASQQGSMPSATLRLVGACDGLLNESVRRGKHWLKRSYLLDRLTARLGSTSSAEESISLAVQRKVAFLSQAGDELIVQTAGVFLIQSALSKRLIQSFGQGSENRVAKPGRIRFSRDSDNCCQILLIHAPCELSSDIVFRLSRQIANAYHICSSSHVNKTLLAKALGQKVVPLPRILTDFSGFIDDGSSKTYIVYDVEELSITTISKLLNRISVKAKILLVGRFADLRVSTDGPSIFSTLWLSRFFPRTTLASDFQMEVVTGLPDFAQLSSILNSQQREAHCAFWRDACHEDHKSVMAATYRECAHYGSTMIMTWHTLQAESWNIQFHNENVDLRKSRGDPTTVEYVNRHHHPVTEGDPLVWTKSDLCRGIAAGTQGRFVTHKDGSTAPSSQYMNLRPILEVLGHDAFEFEAVDVDDCALAYAIPLRVPLLFDTDFVIVELIGTETPQVARELMSRALAHAMKAVVVVGPSVPPTSDIGTCRAATDELYTPFARCFHEQALHAKLEKQSGY